MGTTEGPWGKGKGKSAGSSGNHSGSNPWQGGGKGTGGTRPPNMGSGMGGGGQNTPPDIEEFIRRSQERLRAAMPGFEEKFGGRNGGGGNGGGNGGGISGAQGKSFIFGILALVGLWLLSGFYQVAPNQLGVVLRFGEVVRIEQPGLRYHFPEPIESKLTPDVTATNQIEIGYRTAGGGARQDVADESFMLTRDENIINVHFTVFWQVKAETAGRSPKDASAVEQFLFNIRDPEMTVKMAAESAIREVIGQINISSAISDAQGQIADETRQSLQRMLDEYQSGILITQIQLNKVDAPGPVVEAFRDVQNAAQDADRVQKEAIAYRNTILPEARAQANRLIQEAEGYKQQVTNEATGEADRFNKTYAGYALNRTATAERLYLEAIEEVLGPATKVIIDGQKSGGGVVPYLPLPALGQNAPTTRSQN